jgi:hypothetical protein
MTSLGTRSRLFVGACGFLAAALVVGSLITVRPAQAQQTERWLHVRVDGAGKNDEMVRVNVPVSLAEKVVSNVDHDQLHHGHVNIGNHDLQGVDLRAILDAVRTSKDGEFVTVKDRDQDVRVAKESGNLVVHVVDTQKHGEQNVEIHVPLAVVNALLSAGGNDLDVAAALHVLASQGDTELVRVKDGEQTVRIWIDSKNTAD